MTDETKQEDGKVIAFRIRRKNPDEPEPDSIVKMLEDLLVLAKADKITSMQCVYSQLGEDKDGVFEFPGEMVGGYVRDELVLAAIVGIMHKNAAQVTAALAAASGDIS